MLIGRRLENEFKVSLTASDKTTETRWKELHDLSKQLIDPNSVDYIDNIKNAADAIRFKITLTPPPPEQEVIEISDDDDDDVYMQEARVAKPEPDDDEVPTSDATRDDSEHALEEPNTDADGRPAAHGRVSRAKRERPRTDPKSTAGRRPRQQVIEDRSNRVVENLEKLRRKGTAIDIWNPPVCITGHTMLQNLCIDAFAVHRMSEGWAGMLPSV